MLKKINKDRGYIALLSVLVVGAIVGTLALTIPLLGLGASRTSFIVGQGARASSFANACAEEALMTIRDSVDYVGTDNLTLGQGSCSYIVSGTSPNKIIQSTGEVGTIVRRVQIVTDAVFPQINVVSWREVSDF